MKIWIFIFAFVASQLAWNLRPFLGSRDLPFSLFREHEGNFYIALIQSVKDMASGEHQETTGNKGVTVPENDSTRNEADGR